MQPSYSLSRLGRNRTGHLRRTEHVSRSGTLEGQTRHTEGEAEGKTSPGAQAGWPHPHEGAFSTSKPWLSEVLEAKATYAV